MTTSNGDKDSKSHQIPLRQVLIVEDDPVMQLGLEQFFEDYSQLMVVEVVGDGFLAVEASAKLRPDLIIMDIGLPQMDGITATKKIKAKLPNVRIVMLTSHNNETETGQTHLKLS